MPSSIFCSVTSSPASRSTFHDSCWTYDEWHWVVSHILAAISRDIFFPCCRNFSVMKSIHSSLGILSRYIISPNMKNGMRLFWKIFIIMWFLLPNIQYDVFFWCCHTPRIRFWTVTLSGNSPICWNSSIQTTMLILRFWAMTSGRLSISSGEKSLGVMPNVSWKSLSGSGE